MQRTPTIGLAAAGAAMLALAVAGIIAGLLRAGGRVGAQTTETVPLARGCNNVTATWPSGTPVTTIADAVAPRSALLAVWRLDAARGVFTGWSPASGAPADLVTLGRLEPLYICVAEAATLTRPAAAPVNPTVTPALTPASGQPFPPPVVIPPMPTPDRSSAYPWHRGITATVFWIGEPGDAENDYIPNDISAWDDRWQEHYGGVDDPYNRNGFYPAGFTPRENPFYFDLPYNDFQDNGRRRPEAASVVYWGRARDWGPRESMLKNRWARIVRGDRVCYGQWEDAGPFTYDDAPYVFGSAAPRNREANGAGMDVSPALRDCLGFQGLNNAENRVDWQFVDDTEVPNGPWRQIVTTRQVFWE